jgi:hypothetical protein
VFNIGFVTAPVLLSAGAGASAPAWVMVPVQAVVVQDHAFAAVKPVPMMVGDGGLEMPIM